MGWPPVTASEARIALKRHIPSRLWGLVEEVSLIHPEGKDEKAGPRICIMCENAHGAWDIACTFGAKIFAAMGGIVTSLAVRLVTENRVSYDFPLSQKKVEEIRDAQALAAATRAQRAAEIARIVGQTPAERATAATETAAAAAESRPVDHVMLERWLSDRNWRDEAVGTKKVDFLDPALRPLSLAKWTWRSSVKVSQGQASLPVSLKARAC